MNLLDATLENLGSQLVDANKKPPFKMAVFPKSGRWDLNPGPLTPHASALAGLRHAPISECLL